MPTSGINMPPLKIATLGSYFNWDRSEEDTSLPEWQLQKALELLERIAGVDEDSERQSLLGKLYHMQKECNGLVERIAIRVEKLPEGGYIVNESGSGDGIGDVFGLVADVIAVGETIFWMANFFSKGKLKKWFGSFDLTPKGELKGSSKIVPKALPKSGPKVLSKSMPKAPPKSGPKVLSKSMPKAPPKSGPKVLSKSMPKTPPKSGPRVLSKSMPKVPSAFKPKIALKVDLKGFLKNVPKMFSAANLLSLAKLNVEWLAMQTVIDIGLRAARSESPEIFDGSMVNPPNKEELESLKQRAKNNKLTDLDFRRNCDHVAYRRNEYLDYLQVNNQALWKLEKGLGEDISFLEADKRRIEERANDWQKDMEWAKYSEYDWEGNERLKNPRFEKNFFITKEDGQYVKHIRPETLVKHKQRQVDDGLIPNPLTGAGLSIISTSNKSDGNIRGIYSNVSPSWSGNDQSWDIATVASSFGKKGLVSEEQNMAPYRLEPETSGHWMTLSGSTMTVEGWLPLISALQALTSAYALPRVVIGSLAESLVVREDADIDQIASQLAIKLREAQMVN